MQHTGNLPFIFHKAGDGMVGNSLRTQKMRKEGVLQVIKAMCGHMLILLVVRNQFNLIVEFTDKG